MQTGGGASGFYVAWKRSDAHYVDMSSMTDETGDGSPMLDIQNLTKTYLSAQEQIAVAAFA